MAGKFLPLEEAARHLGMTADEIHRLVDRKKLFPLRDGGTLKFKIEELDRLAAEGVDEDGDEGNGPLDLALELELADDAPAAAPGPGGGTIDLDLGEVKPAAQAGTPGASEEIVLADSGVMPGGSVATGGPAQPGSVVSGGSAAGPSIFANDLPEQDDVAMTMLATGEPIGLDAMELDLDSIVGLSSPVADQPSSLSKPAQTAAPEDSGTLAIDLSGVGGNGSGLDLSNAAGSLVLGSGIDAAGTSGSITNAGAALSGALDSGLSLEDGDAAVSGIDLGPLDDGSLADGGATALAGEEFDLGGLGDDDESASVVAVEPESGDSSFFATGDGESSGYTGDIPLSAESPSELSDLAAGAVVPDTRFNVWLIAGLVCCSLLLLTGGFVMFDLMRTIGSPGDLSLSSPLLNPLAGVFGWR